MKKLSNTEAALKKSAAYKKSVYWKSEKSRITEVINKPIIYKFFKDFTNHIKKTNRAVVFSSKPFPNILKACVRYFYQIFISSPNDSPSKTMKNVFYFI